MRYKKFSLNCRIVEKKTEEQLEEQVNLQSDHENY